MDQIARALQAIADQWRAQNLLFYYKNISGSREISEELRPLIIKEKK